MKREDLKNMGLSDEQISQIMAQNGQDIENAKQGAAAAEKARADELQRKLHGANTELENARSSAGNEAELKRQLDEANAKLKAGEKKSAILDALAQYKPRDAKMLIRLLDDSKIEISDDGTITGLKEQVEGMKASSAYLFSDSPDDKGGSSGAGSGGGAFDMNAFLRG